MHRSLTNIRWRRQRRVVHEGFNKSAANRFHAAQTQGAVYLASALGQRPNSFCSLYHTFACSAVLSVTYDRPVRGGAGDKVLLEGVDTFAKRSFSATALSVVEILPWIAKLPNWMVKRVRDARVHHRETSTFFLGLIEDVENRLVSVVRKQANDTRGTD